MKETKKKREPWIKKRHAVVRVVAGAILKPYVQLKYGVKMEKFKDQGDRQYLILANHQTGFDQFFVSYCFRGPIYYIASEDIFSMGFISDLLRWAVNPIPIKKQSTDVSAVLNCLRVAREGGTIAVFPEGNRTFSGKTEFINSAIVMLAKKMGLPIAIVKIEGGYGVAPRWSNKVRKGNMRAYVSRVIEPDEYKTLDNDAFGALLQGELAHDDTQILGEFKGKGLAEYLERLVYVCPHCGLSTFESNDDIIKCKKCGLAAQYLPNKEFKGVNGDFPYRFVKDWYEAQGNFINSLELMEYCDEPLYREDATLYEVIVYKNKRTLLDKAQICLYGDRFEISQAENKLTFAFEDIRAITVCGKNKLNFYVGDKVYQVVGGARFNAVKYVNLVFRYRNIKKKEGGEDYDEFLGL